MRPSLEALAEATASNKSFSRQLPGLQTTIDSTSLGEYKTCPRKYLYSIVLGLRPKGESVHLVFGDLLHKSREGYEKHRAVGLDHETALRECVRAALAATWNSALGRPIALDHKYKNRLSLIRSIVWYLDEKANNDPLQTIMLSNGKPAVELSFTIPLGIASLSTDEDYAYCGHIDRLARLGDDVYGTDIKTTGGALGPGFFADFNPNGQMTGYTFAGKIILEQPMRGMIIDGLQIGATFTRCERGPTMRSDAQIDEWRADTEHWLRSMEQSAVTRHWPMNDKSCGNYGGCPFREVCARTPAARQMFIDSAFTKRVWDPLERR